MTIGTPSSAFEHDPLPDSTTHFRLLHILRGDFGQHVECKISSWPIDDAPSYYAISYTWGDPADTAEITVNGKPLAVRRNCEYVLQQAFTTKASRYYWVDAICIAQTSIQERNHQVGIMGKIYSGAKHVFACVGSHADDSEYLMATVARQRPILENINKWGQSTRHYDTLNTSSYIYFSNSIGEHMCWQSQYLFSMRTSGRLRTSEAFVSFMRRPYFTRVWVLQELHLATGLSYCCGADVQPGDSFRALDSLVGYRIYRQNIFLNTSLNRYQSWLLQRCRFSGRRSKDLWLSLRHAFEITGPSRVCLRLGVSAQKHDLDDILAMLHGFRCVDTRDYLYGILSLVKWPQGQVPAPDYTKDRFEVAKHFLSLWSQDDYESFRCRCHWLFGLFNVTLELASLRDAIALRSSVAPQPDVQLQDNHHSDISKVQRKWRGIHIVEGNRISEHSCYVEQVQNGRLVSIRIGSQITVCAHVDTRVGDWCLVDDVYPFLPGSYGLILRGLDDHKYVVVGSALINKTENRSRHSFDKIRFSLFNGWSDPEDLMVLEWMFRHCTYKIKDSDKDIEKFVNMRVCGWRNSSYFERVMEDV